MAGLAVNVQEEMTVGACEVVAASSGERHLRDRWERIAGHRATSRAAAARAWSAPEVADLVGGYALPEPRTLEQAGLIGRWWAGAAQAQPGAARRRAANQIADYFFSWAPGRDDQH